MSAMNLTHTCAACGAEESLDSLLLRMLDDDRVRRLIADVLCNSLPVGGMVVRYLRLHKPAKHKLRMERVAAVLGELVPAITAERITRKGRDWTVSAATWKAAFSAVFEAHEKGTLTLPLDGNAYLFEIAMRLSDRDEAGAERERETDRRHHRPAGPVAAEPTALAAAVATTVTPPADGAVVRTPPPADVLDKLKNLRFGAGSVSIGAV